MSSKAVRPHRSAPLIAGVVGDAVIHSKSPLIHNTWLRAYDVPGVYAPFQVDDAHLPKWLEAARSFGLVGFNVTKPHKETMLNFVDALSDAARSAGSVNTVVIDAHGRLYGDSTDGFGFCESMREGGVDRIAGSTVAFLGAGGAARAVLAALLERGAARLRIANRTVSRAEALVAALDTLRPGVAELWPWTPEPSFFDGADLVVNGTSLGMAGQAAFEIDLPRFAPNVVATDLIYAPLETPFLRAAQAMGARTIDGLGMLLHQAAPGFERWFGVGPTVTPALRAAVLAGHGFIPGASRDDASSIA